ncbi:MAG: hypothetical protein H5U17_13170 [Defluviimonas sp.]|nr:hypothetical protein [Defluviimonas sp.]
MVTAEIARRGRPRLGDRVTTAGQLAEAIGGLAAVRGDQLFRRGIAVRALQAVDQRGSNAEARDDTKPDDHASSFLKWSDFRVTARRPECAGSRGTENVICSGAPRKTALIR